MLFFKLNTSCHFTLFYDLTREPFYAENLLWENDLTMLSTSWGQGHHFIFCTWNSFWHSKCLSNLNFEFKWNDAENFTLATVIHLSLSQRLLSCRGESLIMRFLGRLFWWQNKMKTFFLLWVFCSNHAWDLQNFWLKWKLWDTLSLKFLISCGKRT